ncbi:MAG: outer membrane protein [Sphingorhabdus sp.]
MKKLIVLAAVAAATLSSPAMAAGEGRVEGRAGILWAGGFEDFVAGVAAGYDFDLGESAFAGPEVSYDTDFDGGDALNLSLRAGVKAGEKTKLYVAAGYEVADIEEFNAGVGIQHSFSEKIYGKVEYRQFFNPGSNVNIAGVGLGVKF